MSQYLGSLLKPGNVLYLDWDGAFTGVRIFPKLTKLYASNLYLIIGKGHVNKKPQQLTCY